MIELRPYQRAAVDSVFSHWQDGGKHPLVVAPCGAGKSLMIGQLVMEVCEWPDTRVLVLTHRKELLVQDEAELQELWPLAPTGFLSSGLKQYDYDSRVLFGGIQTVARHVDKIGEFDLVMIDEAHLVPRKQQTQYGKVVQALLARRPKTRFIGFSATPYRLDSGMLHEGDGALFDGISYDITLRSLIDGGHLVEVVAQGSEHEASMEGVHVRAGEYVQKEMSDAFDKVLEAAALEAVQRGLKDGRKAWLFFCSSVHHAKTVTRLLQEQGIPTRLVTGSTPADERDKSVAAFKRGEVTALVNVNVLTIGFNAPNCDMLVLLRSTVSTALYVQIVGRVMRTAPGKKNGLLLDYGGNVERHGLIDMVKPKEPGKGGEAPVKKCPECQTLCYTAVRQCPNCGHAFPDPEPKVERRVYEGAVMSTQIKPKRLKVDSVTYRLHKKLGKPDSVRVDYHCGIRRYSEWLMPEHRGFPTKKSARLVMRRYGFAMPLSAQRLIDSLKASDVQPAMITVTHDGEYFRVSDVTMEKENGQTRLYQKV